MAIRRMLTALTLALTLSVSLPALADEANVRYKQGLALKRQMESVLPRYGQRLVNGEPERIDVVEHLFREIAPRFVGRPGGYTRILKTRNRRGDNAELALIELVERDPRVGRKAAPAPGAADAGVSVDSAVRAEAPKPRKESDEGAAG